MTGQWHERKAKGKCTRCGVNDGEGKRKILCGVCAATIKKNNEQYGEAVTYYDKDKRK